MKSVYRPLVFACIATVGMVLTDGAIAHSQSLSRCSPSSIQRLARDLQRSSSEDFFRQGKERFEREVQRLSEPRSRLREDLLKINPSLEKQQNLSPLESPELKPQP